MISENDSGQNKLPVYEWIVIFLFCSILIVIASFALIKSSNRREQHQHQPPTVKEKPLFLSVSIEGAVAFPGTYELPIKSTGKELLNLAKPLSDADLSHVKQNVKLKTNQVIQIPTRKWMTIFIEGAVETSGPLSVLSGTRYHELIKQLKLLPEADRKTLSKMKRYIQEGDTVHVPFKPQGFK